MLATDSGTLTGARFNPTNWWPNEEEKDAGEGAGTPRATPRGEEIEGVVLEEDGIGGPEETEGNWEWGWGCCHGLCTV